MTVINYQLFANKVLDIASRLGSAAVTTDHLFLALLDEAEVAQVLQTQRISVASLRSSVEDYVLKYRENRHDNAYDEWHDDDDFDEEDLCESDEQDLELDENTAEYIDNLLEEMREMRRRFAPRFAYTESATEILLNIKSSPKPLCGLEVFELLCRQQCTYGCHCLKEKNFRGFGINDSKKRSKDSDKIVPLFSRDRDDGEKSGLSEEEEKQLNNYFQDFFSSSVSLIRGRVPTESEEEYDDFDDVEDTKNNKLPSLLVNCLIDLLEKIKNSDMEELIGRKEELERCWQILAKKKKNNAMLVGDPGVGKTSVALGIAKSVLDKNCPHVFYGTKVFQLNITGLIAGTRFRGDLEEKLSRSIAYLTRYPGCILFIDEIHNVISGGLSSNSPSVDIANMLLPHLEAGTIRCIAATTHNEYRHILNKHEAFRRRFTKIVVSEPTLDETRDILNNCKAKYEAFHNVVYTDEAIDAALVMPSKYLKNAKRPDICFDVLDECGARMSIASRATECSEINASHVRELISSIAAVDVLKGEESDVQRYRHASENLKKVIFGQDEAIDKLVRTVKLALAGLRDSTKTRGNFLFAGPTGVGKTELAKQLAVILNVPFIRFDMSEYQEHHSVSKLIGAPPGYIGYDTGGLLTKAVTNTPHCVLLLDEIEKAAPEVYNCLLQIMDAARLTDNSGTTTDFQHVVLIMTSNAGARDLSKKSIGYADPFETAKFNHAVIENTFAPEFRNRLDAIVPFNPLTKECMHSIVLKNIGLLNEKLQSKAIRLEFEDAAVEWLCNVGYDPAFGARPLLRAIESELLPALSDYILFTIESVNGRKLDEVELIHVCCENNKLILKGKDYLPLAGNA